MIAKMQPDIMAHSYTVIPGAAISCELIRLGYEPSRFQFDSKIPTDIDLVFSFGPYGRFLSYAKEFAHLTTGHQKPILIH